MEASLAELKRRLAEIDDLERTQLLLQWDTEVWMPPSGESSRGAQLETLETIVHERQIDDRLGELLDDVEPYAASLPHDADDACLVRFARRRFEKKRRVPTDLAVEIAGAQVEAYQAWVKAREESSFAAFRPQLERMLELKLRLIECFAPYEDPYDVLLDDYEEGVSTADVRAVFAVLQPEISALVAEHAGPAGGVPARPVRDPAAGATFAGADRALRCDMGCVPPGSDRPPVRSGGGACRRPVDDPLQRG